MSLLPINNYLNSPIEQAKSAGYFGRIKNLALRAYERVSNSASVIQVGLTVGLIALSFFPAYRAHAAAGKGISYAVARGAGAALKYLLPAIFVPTLRTIHTKVHEHLPALVSLPLVGRLFHNRMSLHKFTGCALLLAAAVHTAAHCVRGSVAVTSKESATGIAMLAMATLPIAAMYALRRSTHPIATKAREQSYYLQFLLPHQIGWWGLVAAYGLHTKDFRLLPWALGAFGLFSLDRLWEWRDSRDICIKSVERIHKDLVVIEAQKPPGYGLKPGQKAYIAYPAATAFVNRLHPFTIASGPDEKVLRFAISASGDWTRKLVDTIKEQDVIRISPSLPSPLDATSSQGRDSDRLFISSGAGIAMTLAHLNQTVGSIRTFIIHTSRHRQEFQLLNRYVSNKKFHVVSAEYYDTSQDIKSRLRSQNEPPNASTVAGRFIPGQNQLLRQFQGRVFYCGNELLAKALEEAIRGHRSKFLIKEKFNF